MDTFGKSRVLGLVVLLLVVLNIVLLTFLWLGRTQKDLRPNRDGGRYLEEQLQLSPEQIEQLNDLRNSHFRKTDDIRRKLHEAREKLHRLWAKENPEQEVRDASNKIGDLQAQLELATFQHFSDIRKICTDQQKKIFDRIIQDVLRMGKGREGSNASGPPFRPDKRKKPTIP